MSRVSGLRSTVLTTSRNQGELHDVHCRHFLAGAGHDNIYRGGVSGTPARTPVCSPSRTANRPFTRTCTVPSAY